MGSESRHFIRRIFLLVLAVTVLSGCSSWRTLEGPPASMTRETSRLGEVRLVVWDGQKVKVDDAVIVGDSLVAHLRGHLRLGSWTPPVRTAFPMSDIQAIEHREFSVGKTLLLTGGISVVCLGVLAIVAVNSLDDLTLLGD